LMSPLFLLLLMLSTPSLNFTQSSTHINHQSIQHKSLESVKNLFGFVFSKITKITSNKLLFLRKLGGGFRSHTNAASGSWCAAVS